MTTIPTIYLVGAVIGFLIGLIGSAMQLESPPNQEGDSLDFIYVIYIGIIGGILWPVAIYFAIDSLRDHLRQRSVDQAAGRKKPHQPKEKVG